MATRWVKRSLSLSGPISTGASSWNSKAATFQGAPSARDVTIGQGFPSPCQPDKGGSMIYRTDLGPDSRWCALCAAILEIPVHTPFEGCGAPLP